MEYGNGVNNGTNNISNNIPNSNMTNNTTNNIPNNQNPMGSGNGNYRSSNWICGWFRFMLGKV